MSALPGRMRLAVSTSGDTQLARKRISATPPPLVNNRSLSTSRREMSVEGTD